MKRHLSVLACLAIVVAMVFAFASCDLFKPTEDPTPEHTHEFVEGKCECGESDPDYVAPECEHAYGYEVTKEATCTEAGEKTFTCSLCGHSYTQEVAPNGHTEEKIAGQAPTCTVAGLSEGKKCTVCGVVTVEQFEINAAGHSFVEGACTVCGDADPNYNGPKTYTFDAGELALKDKVDQSGAGEAIVGGTNSFFTIRYALKTKVTENAKTFTDGYVSTKRIDWQTGTAVETNAETGEVSIYAAVEITVDGPTTVKVWWGSAGDGRQIAIYNAKGEVIAKSEVESVKNSLYISEFTISEAGKYYVGNPDGNNYYFKLEATVTPVVKNEIKVETTDTYSWIDEYTFTADAEGYYTFNLPAGLGFYSKAKYDSYAAPELDFYSNENGGTVVVGLKEGESIVFYVGALTKGEWSIEWTFEAGEIEDGPVGPSVEIDTELEVGTNSIYAPAGAFGNALECTFVVTEAGTYTFASNYLMAVIVIDENTSLRGQAYLEPGTYVVNIVYYASSEGYYDIDIEYAAPVTGEPDGSEQFPFIWDTIPESVVVDYDVITGKVYYTFTATADGSITFTWPVEFDSWFDYYELDANGNTTANNESGFMANSHTIVVEAGKTYRVSLGSWSEMGSHTITISFVACDHVWSEATCTAPSTCATCGATTGDKAEHTSTVAEPDCAHPDVCGVCGEVIGYFDHSWNDGEVVTPADCTNDGSILYTCTVCGETQEETLWAAHEWVVDVENWGSCTEDGRYEAHCSVCGEIDAYDIEAQGHYNWYATCGDTTTCMECGLEFTVEHDLFPADCFSPAQCSICWQTFGEPLAHNFVDGVCSECYYEDPNYVPPHEHNWSNATCTEPAKCECGETNGEALGHDYDHVVTAPTCTAAGYTTHTCAFCDDTYTDSEVEALGHADENKDYKCDKCSTKMLPADGTALTIPEAIAVAKVAGTSYSTEKYYVTGIVTGLYNTQYGNFYIKDENGNELCIYGLYSADGKTRYDAMSYKPVNGDEVTVYTVLGMYNTTIQGKNAWLDEVVAHEHNIVDTVTDPTCTTAGYTTHTCSICGNSTTDSEVEALGHTTDNGECERCGLTFGGDEPVIGTLAEFTFGANGSASHKDPSSKFSNGKSYTVNGYTLKFTSATNCYDGGNDAKGNSCMKMGTSSAVGSFTVTVADDVTEVVIYVAQYKSNATKISVNGGAAQSITTASNNGAYTAITIDTSVNKTFTFATVSGGVRCMIDTIVFNGVIG